MAIGRRLLAVLAIIALLTGCAQAKAIELDSSNFEKETQAASGQTAGPWLIAFYAEWCGACKRLMPAWHEAARELDREVAVGKVEVEQNPMLKKRFSSIIKGYPTIVLFRDNRMYKYTKGSRDVESLAHFARSGFRNEEPLDVPRQPSQLHLLHQRAQAEMKRYLQAWERFLTAARERGLSRALSREVKKGAFSEIPATIYVCFFSLLCAIISLLFAAGTPKTQQSQARGKDKRRKAE